MLDNAKPQETDFRELQLRLQALNRFRLTPSLPDAAFDASPSPDAGRAEVRFLEQRRAAVAPLAACAPDRPDDFVAWFDSLKHWGPGQNDALFPWLADRADIEDMRWFLSQEVAGEAGFEDLTALTQLRFPQRAKLEMARNYWDEMGRGNPKAMHGPLLNRLADWLGIDPDTTDVVSESLALANTMAGMASNRAYAYHSVGALGAIELTAPGRSAQVAEGLKRLGVPASVRHYFSLHAVLDIRHSAAWNREVLWPLVEADPRVARAIAEGALMRLSCGADCYARYRLELGC